MANMNINQYIKTLDEKFTINDIDFIVSWTPMNYWTLIIGEPDYKGDVKAVSGFYDKKSAIKKAEEISNGIYDVKKTTYL